MSGTPDVEGKPPLDDGLFRYEPADDLPGWMTWEMTDPSRFNATLGRLRVRREGSGARLRMWPEQRHGNIADGVHGGVVMAFVDIALFAACRVQELFAVGTAATIDCSVQFLRPARLGEPLDAVPEILRETGNFVFLRGLVEQRDEAVAAFSATVRRPRRAA